MYVGNGFIVGFGVGHDIELDASGSTWERRSLWGDSLPSAVPVISLPFNEGSGLLFGKRIGLLTRTL